VPILISVEDLEAGMCLARNLVNQFSVLLPHGHKITERDIESLKRVIPGRYVQITDPLLDEMVDFENDTHDTTVSQTVRKNVATVMKKVDSQIRSGVKLDSNNVAGMEKAINDMLEYLKDNPVTMAIVEQSNSWDSYLQEHSANVLYLSMVIGNTIRNYIKNERERLSASKRIHNAMNLTPLASGAMFHDIGMVPIKKVYRKEEPLTEEERELIRSHPEAGANMLPDNVNPMVRMIVRTHHENNRGTGYPQGLAGDKINIFARIVRVADAYTAAISNNVYIKAKTPVMALHEMIHTPVRTYYDPVVLKVLSSIVAPFPVGAKIKLVSGKWAVVVNQNYQDTFKPQVIVAFDELGDPLPKDQLRPPIALSSTDEVMVDSFAGEDLKFINDLAPVEEPAQAETENETIPDDLFDFVFP